MFASSGNIHLSILGNFCCHSDKAHDRSLLDDVSALGYFINNLIMVYAHFSSEITTLLQLTKANIKRTLLELPANRDTKQDWALNINYTSSVI